MLFIFYHLFGTVLLFKLVIIIQSIPFNQTEFLIYAVEINQVLPFDPCSEIYVHSYLNSPQVQKSLHANVTGIRGPWQDCRYYKILFLLKIENIL